MKSTIWTQLSIHSSRHTSGKHQILYYYKSKVNHNLWMRPLNKGILYHSRRKSKPGRKKDRSGERRGERKKYNSLGYPSGICILFRSTWAGRLSPEWVHSTVDKHKLIVLREFLNVLPPLPSCFGGRLTASRTAAMNYRRRNAGLRLDG